MRIERHRSNRTLRPTPQRNGCAPLTLLTGIMLGVFLASLAWVGGRLGIFTSNQLTNDLYGAYQAFDNGDLDATITRAQQVWTAQPGNVEALTLLVRALIYRSYADYDRDIDRSVALQLTTAASARLTTNVDVMAAHALALQATQQPIEAARVASAVLARQPDHTLARMALALSYGGVGSFETALRESRTAVEAAAGRWQLDAQRVLAISLHDMGLYRDAAATVDQAINLNNKLLVLYFERAHYALQVGDADAATVAYFRVLAFDPDNAKARLRLCELSSTLREHETAIRYCQEVTERAPSWAEGWYRLGREYFLQGNFVIAQQALNRCTTLLVLQDVPVSERRFECWYLQGQAAEILGDCDGLVATYNEFRTMAASASLPQTWTYPPEGPAICAPE